MLLCQVTGSVVSTHQREVFRPCNLLVVREVDLQGRVRSDAVDHLALDAKLDAGIGDYVLVAREGLAVADVLKKPHVPANVVVVGVVDDWHIEES